MVNKMRREAEITADKEGYSSIWIMKNKRGSGRHRKKCGKQRVEKFVKVEISVKQGSSTECNKCYANKS
jgi:hypothetical protein